MATPPKSNLPKSKIPPRETPPRYGVMGAGLIGCYLGGLLAASGRAVTLVGRGHVQGGIAANGLQLTHYEDPPKRPEGFVFATDAAALAACDVVLVCVKSQATEAVAREMGEHLRSDTLVVSFQNAIGNADVLEALLPGCEVLPGMVPFNVTSPEPGRFHKGTQGALYVRAVSDHRLLDMKAALEAAGQEVELRDPLTGLLWGKLLMNLSNPLNALSGGPLRAGLMERGLRRVMARCMREGLAALGAAGIAPESSTKLPPRALPLLLSLPTPLFSVLMDGLLKIDPTARSSMLEDLERGRSSENAFLQGEVIRLGRRMGVDVETNRRVSEAVEAAFAAGRSPDMSGRDMVRAFLK